MAPFSNIAPHETWHFDPARLLPWLLEPARRAHTVPWHKVHLARERHEMGWCKERMSRSKKKKAWKQFGVQRQIQNQKLHEIAVSATVFINLMATSVVKPGHFGHRVQSMEENGILATVSAKQGYDVVGVQKITNTAQQATKPHLLKRYQHRKCFALQILWHQWKSCMSNHLCQHRFEHMSILQRTCTVAPA